MLALCIAVSLQFALPFRQYLVTDTSFMNAIIAWLQHPHKDLVHVDAESSGMDEAWRTAAVLNGRGFRYSSMQWVAQIAALIVIYGSWNDLERHSKMR